MSDLYLIWSNEHRGWWGPNEVGYVKRFNAAGRYSREHALVICRNALPTAMHLGYISEIPVAEKDTLDTIDSILPKEI